MQSTFLKGRSRRGATIVMVAVSLAALLSVGALAVDTGMLFKVRADAQRAADAAALAGAAAFLKTDALSARQPAVDMALEYAARNYMGGRNIDVGGVQPPVTGPNGVWRVESNEARVEVAPALFRVRVTIHRASTGTLFANLLGINNVAISTYAAAQAVDAGEAECVMPFAIPDIWHETSPQQDQAPANRWEDEDEEWTYDPADGDRYSPFDPDVADNTQTGYGSTWRDGFGDLPVTKDYGRQVVLKPQGGNDAPAPGNYQLWKYADGGSNSTSEFRDRVRNPCDYGAVSLGDPEAFEAHTSGGHGGIKHALNDRIGMDSGARWDETAGTVIGSSFADWRNSPRVIKVALYSPEHIAGGERFKNSDPISFNNVALFFLEPVPNQGQDDFGGRFLYFASGSGGGPVTGPLVKHLKLVE